MNKALGSRGVEYGVCAACEQRFKRREGGLTRSHGLVQIWGEKILTRGDKGSTGLFATFCAECAPALRVVLLSVRQIVGEMKAQQVSAVAEHQHGPYCANHTSIDGIEVYCAEQAGHVGGCIFARSFG